MNNQSDWLNRANYTAEERRDICGQLLSEAQYWDCAQYLKMMHDSTKRPWVGLSAQEAAECWTTSATQTRKNFEAKLKEKNT
jgi:hypothetical protein